MASAQTQTNAPATEAGDAMFPRYDKVIVKLEKVGNHYTNWIEIFSVPSAVFDRRRGPNSCASLTKIRTYQTKYGIFLSNAELQSKDHLKKKTHLVFQKFQSWGH